MDERPTYISTFSGIEGIGLGLDRAGWRCVAQVEIDAFCNRVRAKRYPGVAQFGDIREFGADSLRDADRAERSGEAGADSPTAESTEQEGRLSADGDGAVGGGGADVLLAQRSGSGAGEGRAGPADGFVPAERAIDLLTGGFPCQDVSVAGRRAGLAGARSGLFYEFVRVARELQPRWLLVENVPGLLSSNGGRDFAVVLRELGDAGYFVEWRVLDSRWFGVAQRRRRVFLVGHFGGPPPSSVLFEPESGGRDPAAGRASGEEVAGTIGGGAPGARGWRGDLDSSGAYIPEVAYALAERNRKGVSLLESQDTLIAHTLRAQPNASHRADSGTYIPEVGMTLKANTGRNHVEQDYIPTLRAEGDDASLTPATANDQIVFGISANALRSGEEKTPSPDAEGRMRLRDPAAVPIYEGNAPTLDATGKHMVGPVPVVTSGPKMFDEVAYSHASLASQGLVAHTLRAEGFDASEDGTGRGTPMIVQEARTGVREYEDAGSLRANAPGTQPTGSLLFTRESLSSEVTPTIAASVRRLTPTECEALQGFPRGWSCLCDADPCTCPDGPRYAALGNAVTVNVAYWIGRRMMAVHLRPPGAVYGRAPRART